MEKSEKKQEWVKPTRQSRSSNTMNRLMQATLKLAKERPLSQITVQEIAKEADCSAASIYRRFKDKEGLLHAAHQHITSKAVEMFASNTAEDLLKDKSLPEVVDEIFEMVWSYSREHMAIVQSGDVKMFSNPLFMQRFMQLRRNLINWSKKQFLERRDQIGHPDPELAVEFALMQAMAAMTLRIDTADLEQGDDAIDDETFLREGKRSFLSYLVGAG